MLLRHRGREIALQILFQRDFNPTITLDTASRLFLDNFETTEDLKDYAKQVLTGIWHHREEIDQVLGKLADNWSLDRMAMVDRNILRISLFELMYLKEEVPWKVVIDEAVELAKKFGSEESSAFVNSLLDKYAKNKNQ